MHLEALSGKNRKIFPFLKNFPEFYLAGGTALALQIGHRVSVDFDFFSKDPIAKDLLPKIKEVFSRNKIAVSVDNPGELTVFVDGVKITFLKYPFPSLFKLVSFKDVRLASVKEIAATKAYSIGRRGSYKDYIDLYYVISGNYCSLPEIMDLAAKKYKNDFNSRLFLEQLIYLEDIEDENIIFKAKKRVDKKSLLDFFQRQIKKIGVS